MTGLSECIHNSGMNVQDKVPGAGMRSVASNISSSLFVMSHSYLYIATHFLFFSLFPNIQI